MKRNEVDRRQGLALLLVILVLAALLVIGTPFVISMRIEEQGSIQSLAVRQGELAAVSARNHAVASLMNVHPSRESGTVKKPAPEGVERPNAQPYEVASAKVDDWDELEVGLGGLSYSVDPENPKAPSVPYLVGEARGRMAGVQVEDEQAKININTAFPTLLGNLLGSSLLAANLDAESTTNEIPLDDTEAFYADDDAETVDGVVVILNPYLLTVEAISYMGKTDTHLTGCFRGEYLSIPQEHQAGWPVFDIRALKVFLHRYYNLSGGEWKTFRTPQAIREIAEWSIVPYFLENLAVLGIVNARNMAEHGLTPDMLLRAGLDAKLLERKEKEVSEEDYREARKVLDELGAPEEIVEMLEKYRGRAAIVQAAEWVGKLDVTKVEMLLAKQFVESNEGFKTLKKELEKIKTRTKGYYPKAIESYKRIYDTPGMETFTAADYERIRDLITTSSSIPSEWSPEQMIEGEIELNPILGVPSFRIARVDWFNPGTLVRIRSIKDPEKFEYQLAWAQVKNPGGGGQARGGGGGGRDKIFASLFQGGVVLKGPLRHSYGEREVVVSALLRHPININQAPRRVIEAVLTGVHLIMDPNPGVRVKEARALAEYLQANTPILGFEHLRDLLADAAAKELIEARHIEAILTNAVNPNHPHLNISTTGFCYATGDVYTVESTGLMNNPAGVEQSRLRVREIVEVAPPDTLVLRLDDQDDWHERIFRQQSPQRSTWDEPTFAFRLPARDANYMITGPIALNRKAWESPSNTLGDLKLLTEEISENVYTWGEVSHFPDTVEGLDLRESGVYTKQTIVGNGTPTGGSGGGASAPSSPSGPSANPQDAAEGATADDIEDIVSRPGSVEFWVRPRWTGRSADRTFFDAIADPGEPDRNRIRLYYDGGTQEIIFQVMDDAGLQLGNAGSVQAPSNAIIGGGEIRHEVDSSSFANDTWYHIHAAWGSTAPGDQALFIDGRPVGRNIWVTRLSANVSQLQRTIVVEDADVANRFPKYGTLLVGTEAVDYDKHEGNIFHVRSAKPPEYMADGRGARGTIRQEHPRGAQVRLLGYAIDIAPADTRLSMGGTGNRILMGKGGANLKMHLLKARIRHRDRGLIENTYAMFSTNWMFPFEPNMRELKIPTNAQSADIDVLDNPTTLGFPPANGYLSVELWVLSGPNIVTLLGQEYIRYGRLRTESAAGGSAYVFDNLQRGALGTTPIDTTSTTVGPRAYFLRICSASVEADVDDLPLRYPISGIIQVDRATMDTGEKPDRFAPDVEWIRYATIAEGRFFIAHPHAAADNVFRGFTGELVHDPGDRFSHGDELFDPKSVQNHFQGQEIFPVIRLTRPQAGIDDHVSIGDSAGNYDVRISEPRLLRIRKVRETATGVFASFYQQSVHNYFVAGNPKLKRFPSGELPARSSGRMVFGGPADPSLSGGLLEAVIDEIRISRVAPTNIDVTAFPLLRGSGIQLIDLPPVAGLKTNLRNRVLRTAYSDAAGVGQGEEFDSMLLIGQGRLQVAKDQDGNVTGRGYSFGDPAGFGFGKREGLAKINDEIFHYQLAEEPAETVRVVRMLQELPKDVLADYSQVDNLVAEQTIIIDPRRDLRSEVLQQILVSTTDGLPPTNGFLEIISEEGREVIYYERTGDRRLINCLRGQLGTPVISHVYEDEFWTGYGWQTHTRDIRMRVVPRQEVDLLTRSMLTSEKEGGILTPRGILTLPHLGVTRVKAPLDDGSLQVEDTVCFPGEKGYLIFDDGNAQTDDEIIAYEHTGTGAFLRARDDRTGRGLFRGRFGTPSDRTPAVGDPVVHFPSRYHDRFDIETDSPSLGYWQRSFRMPGARFAGIHWEEAKQGEGRTVNKVRVLARFDRAPAWDLHPENRHGELFLFEGGEGSNRIDIEAEEIEIRVMPRFLPGAFGRNGSTSGGRWNDDWKFSPIVDSLDIEYVKPWRVLHREDLPF